MALKVVGSTPIIHPIKESLRFAEGFFYGVDDGSRRGRPDRREGKKVSGGHFFSPGETPWMADGTPKECWRSSIKEDVRPLRFAEGFFYGVDDKGVEEGGPVKER